MMRVNVDVSPLESASASVGQVLEMCDSGFDHVSDVTSRLDSVEAALADFRSAFRAAIDSHVG